jgi:SOS-response transcriptional repressor LexA/DNA-binding Xre family transcriptional regulator
MPMEIASRLRELIDQRRLTQSRVAELAGLPNETVNRIVKGTTKNPGVYTMLKIARALDVTLGFLVGEKGFEFSPERRAELRRVVTVMEELLTATQPDDPELQPPNASAVTLGRKPPHRTPQRGRATPASATDWRDSFGDRREEREVDIPEQFAERGATLVFRAEGDSMVGEHIADRDLLYVREEADPRHGRGKIVVCVVSGTPYVKRLELTGGRIRLVSANERFAPMVFDEDTVDWRLVGIVVGWSHDAR